MKKYGLNIDERLHGKTLIDRIFHEGVSIYQYPIKAFVLRNENKEPNKILSSVSKRYFKKAVDRNLLKRRMKEAYRLNKDILTQSSCSSWYIALLYSSKEREDFKRINNSIVEILKSISKS
ncbi:MAG: ribonuclease P protein component [Bacteroidales bacterium]